MNLRTSVVEFIKTFRETHHGDNWESEVNKAEADGREDIQLVVDSIKEETSSYCTDIAKEKDVMENLNLLEQNMDSVVLIVRKCDLEAGDDDQHYTLKSMKLKEREIFYENDAYSISPDSKYAEQHSADSLGTGFFVADDLIVTAAHVLYPPFYDLVIDTVPGEETTGQEIRFVTNFRVTAEDARENKISIPKANVFKPVAGEALLASHWSSLGDDWAVIRVEKEKENGNATSQVCGIEPGIFTGQRVYCLGHGFGLPIKIAVEKEGRIKDKPVGSNYFECNLDLFSGNSGSPIFDSKTHSLVGILVRGQRNFVYDLNYDLKQKYLLPSVSSGPADRQECQTITPILDFLEKQGFWDVKNKKNTLAKRTKV